MSKESTLARYAPGVPPSEGKELTLYMQSNLNSIASMVNSPIRNFPPLNKEPDKPRIGDIAYADGDAWDPGDGPGLYMYTEDGWVLIAADTGAGGGVPVGGIIMWSGSFVPDGWALCDGGTAPDGTPTPNLINSFIKATNLGGIGSTGGSGTSGGTAINTSMLPSHTHTIAHTHNISNHTHTQSGTFNSNETGDHTHGGSTGGAGAHNHGVTQVITGLGSHSAGGVNNRDYPTPPVSFTAAPNHTHSISSDGNHRHTTTISGSTGGSGTLTTGGSSNSSSGSSGGGQAHTHSVEPVFYALAYILRWK